MKNVKLQHFLESSFMCKESRTNNLLVLVLIITFNNSSVFSPKYFRSTKTYTHQTPSCVVCGEFKAANMEYPRFSSKFNAFAEVLQVFFSLWLE